MATAKRPRRGMYVPSGEEVVARYEAVLRFKAHQTLLSFGLNPGNGRVEEVVQDVYCRLLDRGGRRLRLFRAEGEGQLVTFLRRIVERVVYDQVRQRQAQKRGGWCPEQLSAAAAARRAAWLADPAGNPEEQMLADEQMRLLMDLCRNLAARPTGARDLRIFRLALFEGWSSREIARALGRLAPSTVDSIVHRFRRRLEADGIVIPRRVPIRAGRRVPAV